MKRFMGIILVLIMLSALTIQGYALDTAQKGNNINVVINGKLISQTATDGYAFIAKGKTWVGLKWIAQAIGATYTANSDTGVIVIARDDLKLELKVDSKEIKINGTDSQMDTTLITQNKVVYIPIKLIADSFWYSAGHTVKGEIHTISLNTIKRVAGVYTGKGVRTNGKVDTAEMKDIMEDVKSAYNNLGSYEQMVDPESVWFQNANNTVVFMDYYKDGSLDIHVSQGQSKLTDLDWSIVKTALIQNVEGGNQIFTEYKNLYNSFKSTTDALPIMKTSFYKWGTIGNAQYIFGRWGYGGDLCLYVKKSGYKNTEMESTVKGAQTQFEKFNGK